MYICIQFIYIYIYIFPYISPIYFFHICTPQRARWSWHGSPVLWFEVPPTAPQLLQPCVRGGKGQAIYRTYTLKGVHNTLGIVYGKPAAFPFQLLNLVHTGAMDTFMVDSSTAYNLMELGAPKTLVAIVSWFKCCMNCAIYNSKSQKTQPHDLRCSFFNGAVISNAKDHMTSLKFSVDVPTQQNIGILFDITYIYIYDVHSDL